LKFNDGKNIGIRDISNEFERKRSKAENSNTHLDILNSEKTCPAKLTMMMFLLNSEKNERIKCPCKKTKMPIKACT
jgi:hypothetical protein